MNRKLLRGTIWGCGFSLLLWALGASFITDWWWVLAIAGCVLLLVAGAIDWCGRDVGYEQTVFGSEVGR